jgi:signal peptidase II
MSALCITAAVILASDQIIKLLLRRVIGNDAITLGSHGSIRIVARRIWLERLGLRFSRSMLWCVWAAAAVTLAVCSALAPINTIFAGLLLGASLSHVLETSLRGNVTDYICVRAWVIFNLADLALAAGALGLICNLLMVAGQRAT